MVNCSAFLSSDSWVAFAHMPPPAKAHTKAGQIKQSVGSGRYRSFDFSYKRHRQVTLLNLHFLLLRSWSGNLNPAIVFSMRLLHLGYVLFQRPHAVFHLLQRHSW